MIVTLLLRQGKTEGSRQRIRGDEKIASTDPQTPDLQASSAYRDKNFVGAREAIQRDPQGEAQVTYRLVARGRDRSDLQSYAKAEVALEEIATCPDDDPGAPPVGPTVPTQWSAREGAGGAATAAAGRETKFQSFALAGEVNAQNGDTAAAVRYFEQAVALDPAAAASALRLVSCMCRRATGSRASPNRDRPLPKIRIRADVAVVVVNLRQRKFDAALAAVDDDQRKQPRKP